MSSHYTATQPPHLAGRWQYAMLTSRGGGPICGCARDDGHDTREAAERHYWETATATPHVHAWSDPDALRKCERCDDWTDLRISVRVGHLHDNVHVLCGDHAAGLRDASTRVDAVRELVPFGPGRESWSL